MISDKIFRPAVLAMLALGLLMNTCSKTNKLVKKETEMVREIPTRQEVDLMIKIQANEIARKVVYDNNSIVRTTARPDDVMETYIRENQKLQSQLDTLRK